MADDFAYKCNRCGMSFRASKRRHGEMTRCAEPGCGLRFSHATHNDIDVRCYIEIEEVPAREAVA